VDNVKEWALKYCNDKNLTYDELVIKALKLYRNYENGHLELYKYVAGSEFRSIIEKTYKLLVDNDTTFFTKVISSKAGKDRFLKAYKDNSFKYYQIISEKNTEVVIIQNRGEDIAFAVISYEVEQGELGRYTYLHYIKVLKEEFIRFYRNIEKTLMEYIRGRGYDFYDRVISSEIKSVEFQVLYKIYNIKLSLDSESYLQYEYNIENGEVDRENYRLQAVRSPVRFSIPSTTAKKLNLESGEDFFMWTTTKNNSALLTLMLHKDKVYNMKYLYKAFSISAYILKKQGIKEIYVTIDNYAYPIVNDLGTVEILSEEKWVRKML
jgi:hypothetical protein